MNPLNPSRPVIAALALALALFIPSLAAAQEDTAPEPQPLTEQSTMSDLQRAGLTLPSVDAALAFITPTPDQPNYLTRLDVFLAGAVPNVWQDQPVEFASLYAATGGTDVWGLPTSWPKADPNNPSFVYQRFDNGVFFYNATSDTSTPFPFAD
jgi:hypothetical protein